MFDQVFENLHKATESSVKMQQEMFQKWVSGFPTAVPSMSNPLEAMSDWRKKWEEASAEMLKRQKDVVDQNYEAGLKSLEDIFSVADSKSPEEYQEKVMELYRKSFESLRQLSEAQMGEFRAAADKWTQLMQTPA
jgi:hypothetical protein